MKGVDIVDIEVDIYIKNIDRTIEGTRVASFILFLHFRNAFKKY
jgi:hypothetical protein